VLAHCRRAVIQKLGAIIERPVIMVQLNGQGCGRVAVPVDEFPVFARGIISHI
jgi:hypothetical protein